ncbi:uncharacterized protein I206_101734 [Kwoniella pini CBS 10737]|uniref:FAS1 domain-containing protein n=1 Tax=Kwoniella pini CBS 10737 TaxID=1296096 RepID=A0A1B9HVW3_9TREE|nr:uncharacterized protein I206_06298 [Kwoniella pini CBS 10737]OCF47401.1 hypothetical protein I206_06298 [Kwoniella pini CBS 10737]
MANRIPRLLKLHTLPGQLIFLTTISLGVGWGITQLKENEPIHSNLNLNKNKKMQKGDLVDVIESASGGGEGLNSNQINRKGGINLSDALTAERTASIWWNYARDNSIITGRLCSNEKESTILVPIDKAILNLGRKPHQYPGLTYKGTFSTSKINTERFLQAHIIDGKVKDGKIKTLLDGFIVELIPDKSQKGGYKIQPGDIEVLGSKETSNGKILYISKVLPY